MYTKQSANITLYQFEVFRQFPRVVAAASGRHGGISRPPYSTLNASFRVGDDPERVSQNRARICQALGIDPSHLVASHQTHGTNVRVITENDWGQGALDWDSPLADSDALITQTPGVFAMMTFADCVPIVLYDPVRQCIGLVHAGWKGTVAGIAGIAVAAMARELGSDPTALLAGIGPSIGPCCYEVGGPVIEAARQMPAAYAALSEIHNEKAHLDLWSANRGVLVEAGVRETNIEVAALCTSCQRHLFFSHRGDSGHTGRFAMVTGIRVE